MAKTATGTSKPKTASKAKKPAADKPKAAATKKAADKEPKADKAHRPSPPDRDNDGKAGGSLPKNQTDKHALGTADAAIAERATEHEAAEAQIAEDGTATIIIPTHAQGNRARPSVGVNGRVRHLDVGVEVQVNAAELEVLERSDVTYEVVSPLPETKAGAASGVEGSSSGAAASDSALEQLEPLAGPSNDVTQPEELQDGGATQAVDGTHEPVLTGQPVSTEAAASTDAPIMGNGSAAEVAGNAAANAEAAKTEEEDSGALEAPEVTKPAGEATGE